MTRLAPWHYHMVRSCPVTRWRPNMSPYTGITAYIITLFFRLGTDGAMFIWELKTVRLFLSLSELRCLWKWLLCKWNTSMLRSRIENYHYTCTELIKCARNILCVITRVSEMLIIAHGGSPTLIQPSTAIFGQESGVFYARIGQFMASIGALAQRRLSPFSVNINVFITQEAEVQQATSHRHE